MRTSTESQQSEHSTKDTLPEEELLAEAKSWISARRGKLCSGNHDSCPATETDQSSQEGGPGLKGGSGSISKGLLLSRASRGFLFQAPLPSNPISCPQHPLLNPEKPPGLLLDFRGASSCSPYKLRLWPSPSPCSGTQLVPVPTVCIYLARSTLCLPTLSSDLGSGLWTNE